MKISYLLIAIICVASACRSVKTSTKSNNAFAFNQITFHSSACNGTCPELSIAIYSDRRIELKRTLFKGKGQADATRSGTFKGQLEQKEFDQFLALVKEVNWEDVTFPTVTCCDRPVKTIIITYNGITKKGKSMNPPEVTEPLINYLTALGSTIQLPAYAKPIDFEIVTD